jgi:isoleucyl-tRNA synthetase
MAGRFEPVSSRVSFPALEQQVLEFWRQNEIFRKSVEQRPEDKLFNFYEGPPTANGQPGVHHVLARVFKDAIPRYKTMRGYRVPRKGGWDTHGLPVEVEVEKQLGLRSKPDIERYGVEEFNRRCKESVFTYVEAWERLTERIAFWVDMRDAYVTYSDPYMESVWWTLKVLWDRGLIYQGYRSTPHCPRCGTSLSSHEVAQGYEEDTEDPSVFIKFRVGPQAGAPSALRLADGVPTALLAWTTTPWTLPANTALAVDPDAEYLLVEVPATTSDLSAAAAPATASAPSPDAAAPGDPSPSLVGKGPGVRSPERLVLAAPLVATAIAGAHQVLERLSGQQLVGLTYEPLYDPRAWGVEAQRFKGGQLVPLGPGERGPARRVLAADFVSMEDGAGIVHIAPAFGTDDFEAGKREGLLYLQPVDLRGNMLGASPFEGLFVKEADPLVTRDLRDRGLLWRSGTIRHTYPFCWRCGTPLLYYAKPSWYIRTTEVKDRLLSGNERINWYPEFIKWGRFGNWLENNVDWAVSRERYWGTPMPVWRCDGCSEAVCIGSREELRSRALNPEAVDALPELHRPYVDAILLRCEACGGQMQRVPEVLDCWYDTGAMPYAQWHYPFENQAEFLRSFPADYICEAIDQTRGWFYSLHAEATLLNAVEQAPVGVAFKNVICLGHILDGNGEKMSKSRGNVVDPWEVIDAHGADATRWYMYVASPAGQPRRFSADLVGETLRRFLLTLWNTYAFFVTYANIDGFEPGGAIGGERSELDRWVLSELTALVERVTRELDAFNPTDAGRAIQGFVEDLSNWYVRRSRRRFWRSGVDADKLAAQQTLYTCLVTLAKLCAPLVPFTAEALYQNLVRRVDAVAPESVHLAEWPSPDASLLDERLSAETRLVMRLASLGRAARSKAQLKVRQPLGRILVKPRDEVEAESLRRLAPQLLDELNVKQLQVVASDEAFSEYEVKPNLPALGPRYGREVGSIARMLREMDSQRLAAAVRAGEPVFVAGHDLKPEDLLVTVHERSGFAVVSEGGYTVALETAVSPELADEGLVRELTHRLQTLRRDAGLDISDRIVTYYNGDADVQRVMTEYGAYVAAETLSRELVAGEGGDGVFSQQQDVDGRSVTLGVAKLRMDEPQGAD